MPQIRPRTFRPSSEADPFDAYGLRPTTPFPLPGALAPPSVPTAPLPGPTAPPDNPAMPGNEELIAYVRQLKAQGKSNQEIAQAVADRFFGGDIARGRSAVIDAVGNLAPAAPPAAPPAASPTAPYVPPAASPTAPYVPPEADPFNAYGLRPPPGTFPSAPPAVPPEADPFDAYGLRPLPGNLSARRAVSHATAG